LPSQETEGQSLQRNNSVSAPVGICVRSAGMCGDARAGREEEEEEEEEEEV